MAMTPRQSRWLLWCLCGLFAGGTLAAAGWATWWPCSVAMPEPPRATAERNASHDSDEAKPLPPVESFERLASVSLQRPLFDAPPPQAAPPPPPPPFAARLAGTIVEGERSQAIFSNTGGGGASGGGAEFKRVGDAIAGGEVLEISDDGVVVLYHGERLVLKTTPTEGGG